MAHTSEVELNLAGIEDAVDVEQISRVTGTECSLTEQGNLLVKGSPDGVNAVRAIVKAGRSAAVKEKDVASAMEASQTEEVVEEETVE